MMTSGPKKFKKSSPGPNVTHSVTPAILVPAPILILPTIEVFNITLFLITLVHAKAADCKSVEAIRHHATYPGALVV